MRESLEDAFVGGGGLGSVAGSSWWLLIKA